MRVLHVVTRSHLRGAELAALDLAHELALLGHPNEVVALAPAYDGGRDDRLPVLVGATSIGGPRALAMHVAALARTTASFRPDVIVAHGGTAARVAALLPRWRRPRLVWQRILELPGHAFERTGFGLMWRFVARRTDAAVALTPRNGDELVRLGFRGPVWPIPNSRRAARFADLDGAARGRLRAELGIDDATPLIGLVGHLIDQKRPERAVEVLDGVRAAGVPAHLAIVGGGPRRPLVEEAVAERSLGDVVHLLGARHDVPEILAGLDLLVVTSDAEGIPGVVIEAGMAGCPVVSFPFDGAPQVANAGTIVLGEPSVRDMASTVADLLGNPERLAKMGVAAREAAQELSTESVALQYVEHLRELVDGDLPTPRVALSR